MAGGRPTKLTYKKIEQIETAVRGGNYIETAAAYAGISKFSLYHWLKIGQREKDRVEREHVKGNTDARIEKKLAMYVKFSNALEKALADAEVSDVVTILNARRDDWKAAAWRLERKHPEKWGRREVLKHEGEINENHRETHDVKVSLSEEIENDPVARDLALRLLERRKLGDDLSGSMGGEGE